jgi:NADPH2:quinone reductase
VLLDVAAAGVNFPDLLITRGQYQMQPTLPFCPGAEAAGTVRAVGEGVERIAVGDRVVATMMLGAFAEQAVVPEATVAKLPAAIDFVTAAGFPITYGTTYHALVQRAALCPGETLLVLGAAGGVGLAAVDVGKALGAKVIAGASAADKLELCRSVGADEVIDYSGESLKDRAKALSSGGVDVVYDPVGGQLTQQALRAMAWKGRYLVLGFASGEIPSVPLNLVLLKGCQVVGVFWGAAVMRDPEGMRRSLEELLSWLAAGRLNPHVDETFPLERAPEALERIDQRKAKGKLVLVTR